jgi:uncharacterized protein
VIDEYGRPGIWFFSLDASRLGAVLPARATFRLPYMWSRMSLERSGKEVTYSCSRRWPGPRGASSSVVVDIGPPFKPTELTQHDHFLTARWRLFGITGPGAFRGFAASAFDRAGAGSWRRYGIAQHEPWVLHRATARVVDDQLVAAAGLPYPVGDPLVLYSPGVDVRIGAPRRLR